MFTRVAGIRLTYLERERFDRLHFGATSTILREETLRSGQETKTRDGGNRTQKARSLEHDGRDSGGITRKSNGSKTRKTPYSGVTTFGVFTIYVFGTGRSGRTSSHRDDGSTKCATIGRCAVCTRTRRSDGGGTNPVAVQPVRENETFALGV